MNCRTKGHSFERWVAARLRELWPNVQTCRYAGNLWLDSAGVDLINTAPFNFQLKAVEKLSPGHHQILAQMPKGRNINAIIHKKNNMGIVVVMGLDDFLKIIYSNCTLLIQHLRKLTHNTLKHLNYSYWKHIVNKSLKSKKMRTKISVERPLMRANLDPNYWIKESDQHVYTVLLTRMTVIPGKPGEPLFQDYLQTFEVGTWDQMQRLKEKNIDWMKAALVYRYKIVHNPLKNKK